MNDLQTINHSVTMDSREIAELTGKEHKNVLADIDKMLLAIDIQPAKFSARYKDAKGEERRCYSLPYRETMILVSGYSVELRAKVVDRWMELEKKVARPSIPQTYAEALRLAADQADKIEAQARRLEIAAPKEEFFDRVMSSDRTISMNDTAKVLNFPDMGRNRLFAFLRASKVFDSENIPYQAFIDRGYFRVIETPSPYGFNRTTRVYQTGVDFIRKKLNEAGYY